MSPEMHSVPGAATAARGRDVPAPMRRPQVGEHRGRRPREERSPDDETVRSEGSHGVSEGVSCGGKILDGQVFLKEFGHPGRGETRRSAGGSQAIRGNSFSRASSTVISGSTAATPSSMGPGPRFLIHGAVEPGGLVLRLLGVGQCHT